MSKSREALIAFTVILGIVSGWYIENRPPSSHAGPLRALYASPVCLDRYGRPRPGSPTVAGAWRRTFALPIERAQAVFLGRASIDLRYGTGSTEHLSFLATDAGRWRFNADMATLGWVARVCARVP